MRQGFDRFYGYNCQRNAHSFYPPFLDDDEGIETINDLMDFKEGDITRCLTTCVALPGESGILRRWLQLKHSRMVQIEWLRLRPYR